MSEAGRNVSSLKLVGGRLSLDFANTVDWHAGDNRIEYLLGYSDLVAWGRHAGVLSIPQAQTLFQQADLCPAGAAAVLERAIALRESIYRLFSAVSHSRSPETADLATFNEELGQALSQSRIIETAEGFDWDTTGTGDALDQILWPVVRDAADLLTSNSLRRIRECAGDRCGWLFLDTSRNGRRRWCAMEDCGNRAKARRHYQRSRAQQPQQHSGVDKSIAEM